MIDIGNLHVIDYYLHLARLRVPYICTCPECVDAADFDIETEQREGWAYDQL